VAPTPLAEEEVAVLEADLRLLESLAWQGGPGLA
jgi:hypothetical protein